MRKILRADGTSTDLLRGSMSIPEVESLIGAECLDHVNGVVDGRHVMWVDDAGHEKGLPVNEVATKCYLDRCVPGTPHTIRGDVVIVPMADYGD